MRKPWNGRARRAVAVFVDVDGTLAGIYRRGRRALRPGALAALRALAAETSVFLWSAAGSDNGARLLVEFPELAPFVDSSWDKATALAARVDRPFCIDDQGDEEAVLACHAVIVDSFDEADPVASIIEAAEYILTCVRRQRG
jgi:hypothetical protein